MAGNASVMVHIRMNPLLKQQATEVLESMGLSLSDGIRVFLTRLVNERRMPFEMTAPNAATEQAMREAKEILADRKARFESADEVLDALEENSQRQATG